MTQTFPHSPEFLTIEKLKMRGNPSEEFAIFDIRSPLEFAREHIPSSINVPLDEIASYDFSKYRDKNVLFLCRSGLRTKSAVSLIQGQSLQRASCLDGGIDSWKAAGLPTTKNSKVPIDIMRQVQIIAGSLILVGLIGNVILSRYFLLLPLMVGSGLLFAGVSGFCGMARLLSLLPYNQTTTLPRQIASETTN